MTYIFNGLRALRFHCLTGKCIYPGCNEETSIWIPKDLTSRKVITKLGCWDFREKFVIEHPEYGDFICAEHIQKNRSNMRIVYNGVETDYYQQPDIDWEVRDDIEF